MSRLGAEAWMQAYLIALDRGQHGTCEYRFHAQLASDHAPQTRQALCGKMSYSDSDGDFSTKEFCRFVLDLFLNGPADWRENLIAYYTKYVTKFMKTYH